MLSSSVYLSEAEPFLEQYAKRSPQNQALIGSAGNLVRVEDFLAILEGGRDEEGDLEPEKDAGPVTTVKDTVAKDKGLIIFFPGMSAEEKLVGCLYFIFRLMDMTLLFIFALVLLILLALCA